MAVIGPTASAKHGQVLQCAQQGAVPAPEVDWVARIQLHTLVQQTMLPMIISPNATSTAAAIRWARFTRCASAQGLSAVDLIRSIVPSLMDCLRIMGSASPDRRRGALAP